VTDTVRKAGSTQQGKHQEVYEAHRKYPRLILDLPGTLVKLNEEIIKVIIHDLSIDGVQMRCDHQTAGIIYPSGKFIKPGKGPLVQIKFNLPVEEETRKVDATCQIFYISGIGDNQIAFGLQFRKFKGNSGANIDHYIMQKIEPVEDRMRSYLETPRSLQEISEFMHMEVNEVTEMLDRMKIQGDVVSYQDGSIWRNLRLSAALTEIFDTLNRLDKRLSEIEIRLNRK